MKPPTTTRNYIPIHQVGECQSIGFRKELSVFCRTQPAWACRGLWRKTSHVPCTLNVRAPWCVATRFGNLDLTIAPPTPTCKNVPNIITLQYTMPTTTTKRTTQKAIDTHRSTGYGPSEMHSKRCLWRRSSTSPPLLGSLEAGPGN